MTRDKLMKLIDPYSEMSISWRGQLADRILAALDKEREGEVVLAEGKFNHDPRVVELVVSKTPWDIRNCGFDGIHEKKGQLIFRPTKEKI